MSKLESKGPTSIFAPVSVLIFVSLLIMTLSLISLSLVPTVEANHKNNTALKASVVPPAGAGSATLKINTNVYPDSACGSAVKPCPNNNDMWFDFHVWQGTTWYHNGNIDGSPDTIVLKVPVAKSGKTDYEFYFAGPPTLKKPNLFGYWAPGDTSKFRCDGQLSDGQVASCTVNIHWGFYN